jgi:hypothetical protein
MRTKDLSLRFRDFVLLLIVMTREAPSILSNGHIYCTAVV